LLDSVRRIGSTLLAILANRLELFLVELQEQRAHLLGALLLVLALAVCAIMTLILVTFTVVILFWREHRLAVLCGLAALYLAGTLVAAWRLRARLRDWPAFAATLGELKKDRQCLEGKR